MLNIKFATVALLVLVPRLAFAAGEILTVINPTDFGDVVPVGGSCVMDPITGNITPASLCIGPGTLGEYTITATPSTTVRIRATANSGGPLDKIFEPTLYLTNNLGHNATNLISGTDVDFDTGTDGIITVYIGGTLTFPAGLLFSSNHTVNTTLEFNEI